MHPQISKFGELDFLVFRELELIDYLISSIPDWPQVTVSLLFDNELLEIAFKRLFRAFRELLIEVIDYLLFGVHRGID